MVNWEALGAIGEIVGAIAVVATLGYLAIQIRSAKAIAADANRQTRAASLSQVQLAQLVNDDLRGSIMRASGVEEWHHEFAERLGVDRIDAERIDMLCIYHFWVHWAQYSGSTTEKDLEELRFIVRSFYRLPSWEISWNEGPFGKRMMDPSFVQFVDSTLASPEQG